MGCHRPLMHPRLHIFSLLLDLAAILLRRGSRRANSLRRRKCKGNDNAARKSDT